MNVHKIRKCRVVECFIVLMNTPQSCRINLLCIAQYPIYSCFKVPVSNFRQLFDGCQSLHQLYTNFHLLPLQAA